MENEWRVGEIKQVNGEWYQCVEGKTICSECDLRNIICQRDTNINNPFKGCSGNYRTDKRTVIYKKLEKFGEPCEFQKRTIQTYKLYTEPFITVDMDFIWAYLKGSNTIDIIIKQDIEDMEEKKLKLKTFDIEAAKAGKPVCTRDGRKARIICFDAKGDYPIVALIDDTTKETNLHYTVNGRAHAYTESDYDLMMLPEKRSGWINIYKGGLLDTKSYSSKEEAVSKASQTDYIDTIKIEWEE